ISDEVPERVRALRASSGQPRAEDHIGDTLLDRLDERRNISRVVLEICVLDDGDVAIDVRYRRTDCSTLSAMRTPEDEEITAPHPGPEPIGCLVGGSVVDNDHLLVHGKVLHARQHLRDRRGLVVHRDDERDSHDQTSGGCGAADGMHIPKLAEIMAREPVAEASHEVRLLSDWCGSAGTKSRYEVEPVEAQARTGSGIEARSA